MEFKFEKKPILLLNQTWYHLFVDGKKVSQVIVEHLPQSPIHNIELINTFSPHKGKGYMGKLLEHVRDDLLAHMKNNEYITAKPVNDTSAHLLEKYFAPLRKECRFCDAQMVPTGNHLTSCRLQNDNIQSLRTPGILQVRSPSVERHRNNSGRQRQQ